MKDHLLYSCEHIILRKVISDIKKFLLTTISTDPANPSPYTMLLVQKSNETDFGALGKYIKTPDGLSWNNLENYGKHEYELVTVLDIVENKLIIYGENIGEDEIRDFNSSKLINGFHERRFHFLPKPGHKLLIRKHASLGGKDYDIIHNITFAKRKWIVDQHFI
jgi:hypothetical protein